MHLTKRLGRAGLTALHMVFYAVFGLAALSILASIFFMGIAGLFIVFGVIPLALFALALAGVARFEDARVSGLFGLNIPQRPLRQSTRTDWLRVPHTLWLQYTDRQNWRGFLHFMIISLLGVAVFALVEMIASAVESLIALAVTGGASSQAFFGISASGPFVAVLAVISILLALAGILGLAAAHQGISTAMLVPSREAELERTAVVATARRDDAVSAASIERARLERDLHDGVQPRLVSVGMTLGMAKAKIHSDPDAAAALIDEAHTSTKAAITELRQLARGFHPAVLADRGLDAALSALAARSHVPVLLDVALTRRFDPQVESAMYFAIAESITNAAKHSGASNCRVTVRERPGDMLWARIEDDGRGGAQRTPGGGIDGIAGRVSAAGGTLSVTSPVGGPTTIEVSLPCAS